MNKKNLQPPCRRKICEKFVKISEKREILHPYKKKKTQHTNKRARAPSSKIIDFL